MDAKYLAEIKAREQAATPGPWCAYGYHVKTEASIMEDEICETERLCDADFILYARTDVPPLLAEVERLTEENDVLKSECKAHIRKQADLFKGYQQMKADNAAKDRQIATLKKALEIASTEANKLFSQLETFEIIKVDRKASCVQENIDVWIHRAQEQLTHESTHERDKSALESCRTCQKVTGCPHRRFEPNDYEPCAEYQAQEQEGKK